VAADNVRCASPEKDSQIRLYILTHFDSVFFLHLLQAIVIRATTQNTHKRQLNLELISQLISVNNMQFTSTLLFFTFIAANLCSPVPDAPPQVSIAPSAECFMLLGLNLTIVKPLTDVVYSFQHSHVAVTVKAGTDYVDNHDHVSLGISIGSDSEEMSTDAIFYGQGE